jgi:nucleolar protein 15
VNDPAVSAQALEAAIVRESDISTKPKHKPRKRAVDFLSDAEDNATDGASAPVPERAEAEMNERPKEKKLKRGPPTKIKDSNTPDVLQATKMDTEVNKPKKSKNVPALSPSDAPPVKPSKERQGSKAPFRPTGKADDALETPLPALSKGSRSRRKKGKGSANAEALTADGVNGVIENVETETLQPLTNKDPTSASLQVEGQETVEKELEDEWGSEDEEEDQGAALLAGFDSDGDDNTKDVGFEAGKPLPKLPKEASEKAKEASQKDCSEDPGTIYVG